MATVSDAVVIRLLLLIYSVVLKISSVHTQHRVPGRAGGAGPAPRSRRLDRPATGRALIGLSETFGADWLVGEYLKAWPGFGAPACLFVGITYFSLAIWGCSACRSLSPTVY